MVIERILGNLREERFAGLAADPMDFEWFEAHKKVHRKRSRGGRDVALRFGDSILAGGLRQGDVLLAEGGAAVTVNFLPCDVLAIDVGDASQLARVCYEIGNRHAPLFRGDGPCEFVTPYDKPLEELMMRLGVAARREARALDFDRSISSAAHAHTH